MPYWQIVLWGTFFLAIFSLAATTLARALHPTGMGENARIALVILASILLASGGVWAATNARAPDEALGRLD